MKKKVKIVYVEWVDSDSMHGWNGKHNLKAMATDGLHYCQTAGFLYASLPDRIVIVQSVGESTVGELMRIPRIAIKKVRDLYT